MQTATRAKTLSKRCGRCTHDAARAAPRCIRAQPAHKATQSLRSVLTHADAVWQHATHGKVTNEDLKSTPWSQPGYRGAWVSSQHVHIQTAVVSGVHKGIQRAGMHRLAKIRIQDASTCASSACAACSVYVPGRTCTLVPLQLLQARSAGSFRNKSTGAAGLTAIGAILTYFSLTTWGPWLGAHFACFQGYMDTVPYAIAAGYAAAGVMHFKQHTTFCGIYPHQVCPEPARAAVQPPRVPWLCHERTCARAPRFECTGRHLGGSPGTARGMPTLVWPHQMCGDCTCSAGSWPATAQPCLCRCHTA
jgi:hypothetical protein